MRNSSKIQKLLEKQKGYMNVMLNMTAKLNSVQNQISELSFWEFKKEQSNSNKENELLSSDEACKYLKISMSTLYRLRLKDGLSCIKLPGRKNVMFRKNEINEFINLKK